ncbi:hypothetical protein JO40_11615 [Treponema putidum]|uniref:hypothetical protein n=1 Tax=Treponema putidum TaxID=221027 RepID=UPI0004F8EF3E|nr:hypothetical protein [Treponema putidum]AIN94654.1 hypothetical protein JO40_11615 [Treponema putidum]
MRVCDLYKNTVLSAKNSFNIPIDILTILLENKETQSILMNDVNEKEYKSWTQDIGEQLFIDWMEITNKKILVLSITISRKYEEIFLTQFNEDKIFCLQNKKMETNKYKKQTDKTYYTFDDIKNCVMNGLKIKRSNKGFSPIVNIVYIEIE